MKRGREELEADGESPREQAAAQEPAAAEGAPQQAAEDEDEEEDDKPLMANYKMSRSVRKGAECPYLDTISRQVRRPPAPFCRATVWAALALLEIAADCIS